MADTEKIRMPVKIAGEAFYLNVGFDEQDFVRTTESKIDELFADWRVRFPSKTVQELLAMMTYQYASYYLALSRNQQDAVGLLQECDKKLDRALLDAEASPSDEQ